jgi:hypothetical protein
MALITAQPVTQAGPATTYTAVNASDTFTPGDQLFLDIKTTGTTITVTVVSPSGASSSCNFGVSGSGHNLVLSATGTAQYKLGPLTAARFGDPTTGLATVTYSPTTGCTAALVQF